MRRVDRLATVLGRPVEDVEHAMKAGAAYGEEQRVASLSVRLAGGRTFTYERLTAMDKVAKELGMKSGALRQAMRQAAAAEGKETGVWTVSVRIW